MSIADEARKIFNLYKSKLNTISTDLKPEVQRAQKQALDAEFKDSLNSTINELRKNADDYEKARQMYSDREFMLVSNSVRNTEKFTAGDAALISALPGLNEKQLGYLIDQGPKPGVLMACLNFTKDSADLRQKILAQVQLPEHDIKAIAGSEIDCLNVLLEAPGVLEPTEKLAFGYRIKAAQAAMQ